MDDMTEPIKLTFFVRLESRTKNLYTLRSEDSLVQHQPQEIEDRLRYMVMRATKEIRDSGFTAIELGRIRRTRDASLAHLKKKGGNTDAK